jgi:four helix bundle protein
VDDNIIREKAYSFALHVVGLHKRRKNCETGRVMFSQLLRCGTSVGANVEEAQGAQSRRDFITKMAIARKEAYEAHYWLRL